MSKRDLANLMSWTDTENCCGTRSWTKTEEDRQTQPPPPLPPVAESRKTAARRKRPAAPGASPAPKRRAASDDSIPLHWWLPIQYLLFACSVATETLSTRVREFMELCRTNVAEPDCHEFLIRLNPLTPGPSTPGPAPTDLTELFPDSKNYRNLEEYFDALVPQVSKPWKVVRLSASTPPLRLTGPIGYDVKETKGAGIVEMAKQWIRTKVNRVYDHDHQPRLPGSQNNRTIADYRAKFHCPTIPQGSLRMPVDLLVVQPGFNENELNAVVNTSAVSLIRGLGEALGLDWSIFTVENLLNIVPEETKIENLRQRPQPATSNLPLGPDQSFCKWHTASFRSEIVFKTFADNYLKLKNMAIRGFNQLKRADDLHFVVDELAEKIKNGQLEMNDRRAAKADPGTTFISFGSNFDLVKEEEAYKPLIDLLNKLPPIFHPTNGLLEHVQETIFGVNGMQVYFKGPGSRTGGHQENQMLASININVGPGDCVWICVPFEFSAEFTALLRKKNGTPYHTAYWPNEDDLLKAGIPVTKFVQKPGDVVSVGVGTFHWVQSNGFAVNVSWNFAQLNATQLAATMLSHDHNAAEKYHTVLPIVPTAWKLVREQVRVDEETKSLLRSIAGRSLAKSVFEEDFAVKKGMKLTVPADGDLKVVERCSNQKCPRDVLFNLVVVCGKEEERKAWCVDCYSDRLKEEAKREEGEDEEKEEETATVFRRNTIEELKIQFDRYFFNE